MLLSDWIDGPEVSKWPQMGFPSAAQIHWDGNRAGRQDYSLCCFSTVTYFIICH